LFSIYGVPNKWSDLPDPRGVWARKKLEDGTHDECVGKIDQRSRKNDDGIKE